MFYTGRTLTASKGDPVGGSLTDTAKEVSKSLQLEGYRFESQLWHLMVYVDSSPVMKH